MSTVKSAEERRTEILDAAEKLFCEKGYDATSVADIMREVQIAKGTLYYHFCSKEEMMDGMIERINRRLLAAAVQIAENTSVPVCERLFQVIMSLNFRSTDKEMLLEQIHNPQNALLHQKMRNALVKDLTPVLTKLACEGVEQGIFHTDFPKESVEMILIYVQIAFDEDYGQTQEDTRMRITAFIANLERIFGSKENCFAFVRKLF